jgi:hypothetical protein
VRDGESDDPRALIVRVGEDSGEAMAEKAAFVMRELDSELRALGVDWHDATGVNLYTARTLEPYLERVILEPLGEASRRGLHWFHSRPPILEIEFEMDARGTSSEVFV